MHQDEDGTALIYIDRHLVHEVTSPQAYEGLKLAGRKPWRVDSVVATADHNTPTRTIGTRASRIPVSRLQVETLDANIKEYGAKVYFPFLDKRQGIVHVIGPENGATLPGMTVVCGDSHTSTHGAFAPRVRHRHERSRARARDAVPGHEESENHADPGRGRARPRRYGEGHHARDHRQDRQRRRHRLRHRICGEAIRALSMEGRMTLCNMAIEAGARAGMVAVDDKTIEYVEGQPFAPKGEKWDEAVAYWRTLKSDAGRGIR